MVEPDVDLEGIADEMGMNWRCPTCLGRFSRRVWHCPHCDHHSAYPEDRECGNCHQSFYARPGVATQVRRTG